MNFDALGQNGPEETILGKKFVLHEIGRHQFFSSVYAGGTNRELLIKWPEGAPKSVKRLGMRGYDVQLKQTGENSSLSISQGKRTQRDTGFRNVVEFLMREFQESSTDAPCWKVAYNALTEFKKDNSNKPNEGLKREEIVGLYGELYFIKKFLLVRGISGKRVLEIWKGWGAGSQDFVDREWITEIKTSLARKANDLWINGMRQLAGTAGKALFLCHIYFDSAEFGAEVLSSLVDELKAIFAGQKLEDEFMQRLKTVGYDEILAVDYDHYKFPQFGDATFYDVNRAGFPKIVAMEGEERIKEVKYKVSVADLEEFVVLKESWMSILDSSKTEGFKTP